MNNYVVVEEDFLNKPTLRLAEELLGKILVHESDDGLTSGIIVECEAYIGPNDKAAHSYNNRLTDRTRVMFGPAGYAYIYTIYGLHNCFNVVSGPAGHPEAILVRALEPLEGTHLMKERRGKQQLKLLTNGPGKLTQAMGITKQHYGLPLIKPPLYLAEGARSDLSISQGPRIGIGYAEEAVDFPWRFWITDNKFVSK